MSKRDECKSQVVSVTSLSKNAATPTGKDRPVCVFHYTTEQDVEQPHPIWIDKTYDVSVALFCCGPVFPRVAWVSSPRKITSRRRIPETCVKQEEKMGEKA